ncbi:hypothetical protein [Methylobacterium sp. JK268]
MPTAVTIARTLAALCAVAGLIAMMVAPAPSWGTVFTGLAALVAFATLSLIARRAERAIRPVPRRAATEAAPAQPATEPPVIEVILPPPERMAGAHPAIYRAMRVRRMGR